MQQIKDDFKAYCNDSGLTPKQFETGWEWMISLAAEFRHEKDKQTIIAEFFSSKHRSTIFKFVDAIETQKLREYQDAEKQAAEIQVYLDRQRPWMDILAEARDDFEYEEFEQHKPDAEIIIRSNEIEIVCYRWIDASSLPPGGKYQGKGSRAWLYPLSARPALERLGYPILKYPGVE